MKKKLVIIGAGLAGLSAALTAAEKGVEVQLVSSLPSERAQSVMAEGGINAAMDTKGEDDSPAQHRDDTLAAACGISSESAVRGLTAAAPDIVRKLRRLGVQFNTDEKGAIDLRNFGGQKKKRTAFAQTDTGKQIMTALIDAVRRWEAQGAVKRYSHHSFVTLFMEEERCCGCIIRDNYTGETIPLPAEGVIIASGGLHGLFTDTTGSLINTGEVTAELFRLGIPIANGEMIQYHPTTAEGNGKRMLLTEAARGEGGRLLAWRDGRKWYFMEEKYPVLKNLMPRDVTAREIWKVIHETGAQVYLDLTELPAQVMEHKLSGLVRDCKTYLKLDPTTEPIPVSPGIHYFMGGIRVDRLHRTSCAFLYAAGECCAQYHGANRLGGNSLLGAIYGGQVAADTACLEIQENTVGAVSAIPDDLPKQIQEEPHLQTILQGVLGVVRDGPSMEAALRELESFQSTKAILGRGLLLSALSRQESRGAHFRSDYPERDDEIFRKISTARYQDGSISVSFEEVEE